MNGLIVNNKDEVKMVILDNIKNVSLNAAKRLDAEFGSEIDQIVNRLSEIYWILNIVINYKDEEVQDIKFDSKMTLWQGANSLMGALQLIRLGYFLEPNFLLRHAVENLAIALVLFKDYRRYKDFKSGKLSGEKCIGEAKQVIAQIGQIYGALSDMTHPSSKWLGTYVVEKRKTMLVGGGIVDEHMNRVKMDLFILGFLVVVYLSGVELVFYDSVDEHKFWKRKDRNAFEWSPSENEKKYAKEREEFMRDALRDLENI